jgi:hypothetical protein
MKFAKNIVKAVAAIGFSALLMGCPDVGGEHEIIKISGSKASVEYTNETENFARAFKTLKTKHTSADCIISFDLENSVGSTESKIGVFGYIFNYEENKENGTANFGIIGLTPRQTGEVSAYISYFRNVNKDTLEVGNSFVGLNGEATKVYTSVTDDYDLTALDPEQSYEYEISNGLLSKQATSYVVSLALGLDGEYIVNIYDGESKYEDPEAEEKVVKAALVSKTVKNAWTGAPAVEKEDDVYVEEENDYQMKLGAYVNIYAGATAVGTWEFVDVKNEAIPVAFDK